MLFELLMFVEAGSTTHEVDFTTYALRPGDVLWVHTGQVQRWGEIAAVDGVVCMFPPTVFDIATTDLLGRLDGWPRTHWPTATGEASARSENFRTLLSHFARLDATSAAEGINPEVRDAILVHLTMATVLSIAAAPAVASSANLGANELFRGFRAEIDRHYATDRSVQSYARRIGCSERSLHRLVRGHTGLTPKQVIEARVVLEAKRLLVHGDTPVSEIARALGFHDQSNFTKFFRKAVRQTPSQFRDENT